ncbi:MAG: DUF5011 domain-containing protein, partial [bacterium]|nr:DUF5011 domain-containing protein [bacterium]
MNSDDELDKVDAPLSDKHPEGERGKEKGERGEESRMGLAPGTVLPGTCLNCGASNPQGTRLCQSCGAALFEQCPRCGVEGSLGVRYCGSCGVLIAGYKEAKKALSRAQELLGKFAYDAAQREASRALRLGYLTEELRAVMEAAAARRKTIDELRAQASRLVENEQYEDAEEPLRNALELDPSREDLKSLLAELPRRSQERKIHGALAEARKAIEQKQFPIALERCEWILREQAENLDAAELRSAAKKLQEDHRARMAEAAESLKSRTPAGFKDALKQLKDLERDYAWDDEVERLLREAETRKEERLDELHALAIELVEKERYEDAETPLRNALELDPSREDIKALLAEQPARIRQREIRGALTEAGKALEEKRFPVALERCDWVLSQQADSQQAAEIRTQAETFQEDHRRRMSQARAALEAGRLNEASQQLSDLEEDYSWDDQVGKLLREAEARKNKRLTEFRDRALGLVEKERYEDAELPLRSALELDPSQEELKALLDELPARIRRREIRRALADAGKALEEKRFRVALEQCERVLREEPDNDEAGVLKLHAEKLRKDHEARLARARRLLKDAQLNAAIEQLSDLRKDYPWDDEIGKLLAEAKERKKTLDAIRAQALALVKQERYEEAEKPIRSALEIDQSQDDLKAILGELPVRVRERDIRRALSDARTALQEKRFPAALDRCDWVLQQQPDHKEAASLKARAEKLREDHQSRFERARKSFDTMEAGGLDKALHDLKGLEKEYPWDQQTKSLQKEITTRKKDITRRLHNDAIELVKKEQYEDAEEALRGALKLDPSKKDAEHLLKELPARIQKREVTRALDDARKALREERFSAALEHANWVLREQPGNEEAAGIKAQAEKSQLGAKAAAVFGNYEAMARHARTVSTTVWTARPAGSSALPAFAVKAFDPSESGWDERRVAAERESFQDSLRTQLKVGASDGLHWAPVLESGIAEDKPFFVTKYYRRSAQWLLDHPFALSSRTLHAIVSSVVEGLIELNLACGRPHGNVKPSNILIEGEGHITSGKVVLSDPLPNSRLDAKTAGATDLRALGALIYELVLRRRFRLMGGWPLPATEAWSRLGRNGETWRALCERLLDPDPARSRCSLDSVVEVLKKLDRPRKMRKYALVGLAAAAVVAVPFFFYLRHLQFPKIRVSGDRVIVAEAGTPFKYPEYTATDRQDGDLTKKVKVAGVVDVTRLGEYALSHTVTDSDGHKRTVTRTVKVVDRKPPYATGFSPGDSENVPVGESIAVHIKDDGVGVDKGTIAMAVNGSSVERDRLFITGTENDCTVTYDHPGDFAEYETVTVTMAAADRQGKRMKSKEYTFRTEDKTLPAIVADKPAPDEKDVRIDTGVAASVKDDGAGVQKDSIVLSVKEEGQKVEGKAELAPEPGGYGIRWSPSRPFGEDRKVTVTVSATDLAHPAKLATQEYSFTTESGPPYAVGQKPSADEREVRTSTDILLHVKDDGAGVEPSSIAVTVDGKQVKPNIEGNPKDYEVKYHPQEELPEFKLVTVSVAAKDLDGRAMKPVEYSFTTIDETAPIVYDQAPAEGANVDDGAKVSFRIKDGGAGVDKGAIQITVDGAIVKLEIAETTPGNTRDFAVDFALPQDLAEDRTVKAAVDAGDLYDPPNRMKTVTRNFSTHRPPSVYGQSPQDGAHNVPVDADIKVHVKDAGSGVKKDSVNMTVNGWPVQKNLLKISGTLQDYEVSYNPPTDFSYNATVNVTVEAEDLSGNGMERVAYSFATGRGDIPKFTLQPESVRVKAGVAVTFRVGAASPTNMQYQWKKDAKKIEGATSSSYAIPAAGRSDVGSYVCEVTNLAGPVTSNPATLTIDEPPKITLSSDKPVTWEMGTPFPDGELGYKAADKEDGDLTAKVEVENRVDRTKPGKYAIQCRLKDSAGNEAQAVKTVEVVDTRPPYMGEV